MRRLAILTALSCVLAVPASADLASVYGNNAFGFNSVGGFLGYMGPDNIDATIGFGAFTELGAFIRSAPALIGRPSLSYWGSEGYSEVGINADVQYIFPLTAFYLYGGAGLGLFFGSADGGGSDTDFGATLMGGAGKRFSTKFRAQGELRVKFDGVDTFAINAMGAYVFK